MKDDSIRNLACKQIEDLLSGAKNIQVQKMKGLIPGALKSAAMTRSMMNCVCRK